MVKARHIHESAAMCRTEFVGRMIIGIGTVQEFSRHKVKFSTAAKLTHARYDASSHAVGSLPKANPRHHQRNVGSGGGAASHLGVSFGNWKNSTWPSPNSML